MKKVLLLLFISYSSAQISYGQSGWFWQNPYPTNYINYEKMFNASNGIFYDVSGNFYKTSNGGYNWNSIFSFQNFNYFFRSTFYMFNETVGFMCMDSSGFLVTNNGGYNWNFQNSYGVIDLPKPIFLSTNTGIVYGTNYRGTSAIIKRTTNQGQNWATVLNDTNYLIKAVHFPSAQTGYMAAYNTENITFKFLKTTNSGATWDSVHNNISILNPDCIFFTNDNVGYLSANVGYDHFYKTTNGGVNWNIITGFNNIGIQEIIFLNSNTGFLRTANIYKTTDAGTSWSIQNLNGFSGNSILHIDFIDNNNFFCFGDTALIIKSTNAGADWSKLSHSVTYRRLWDVSFANQNTGFITGDNGTILKTTNGGENWIKTQFSPYNLLYEIAMVDYDHWFLSEDNGKVFRTTNGGTSWDTTYSNAGGITRLKFVNQLTGFGICKYNNFIKTTNGGANWIVFNLMMSQNWALDFANELTGFAGSNKVKKTTDGGLTWDTLSFPVYLYTSDIQFINQNVCYTCGDNNIDGFVLKTTNCGLSWQIVLTTPDHSNPTDLYFVNEQTGYVTDGRSLFKTTNGGVNWTEHHVLSGIYIMNFTDDMTGYGVGDFGTIIKTTNGGGAPIGVQQISNEVPNSFALHQNYPNPFNPVTKIKFSVPASLSLGEGPRVRLIIYDITGREVATLLNEQFSPGTYEVDWDGTSYASGVYFYQLISGEFIQTKKMVLLK